MVGAGAVVTQSVPAFAIVTGNPARITGYAGTSSRLARPKANSAPSTDEASSIQSTSIRGVALHKLQIHADMRGELCVGEHGSGLGVPFAVKRHFLVFNVPSPEVRGQHAHRVCHQMLFCIQGSCSVVADDGLNREEFNLNRRQLGLYLPPLTWAVQYRYTTDAVLMVMASHAYDAQDYIRDYAEFLQLTARRNKRASRRLSPAS
jgi:dTDP-4-dehydrorhamnose 3,5-epimerase-like enzyme